MPLTIVRPQISDDKRQELAGYLSEQWLRAVRGRQEQVDSDYEKWEKAYSGMPLEETRTVPFYKASNFVVKLIRVYLDTFVARSLNIIFATRPLYVADGLPRDLKEAWELYLNRKALYEWNHYKMCRQLCTRGLKTGTAVVKSPWVEKETWDVQPVGASYKEQKFTYFAGPEARVIPFEDFYVYPITANDLCEAEIKFHRIRYTKEKAKQLIDQGKWNLPDGIALEQLVKPPRDVKRVTTESDAGVIDPFLLEANMVECHLDYAITNDSSKLYTIVVVFEPDNRAIVDLYFNPYPRNINIFHDYRPLPREELFYGESICQLLGQSQEEASRIHNERRDNSTIASSVCFKRRSGSLIPNPSTNWYPGKVWDLEDMEDLDVFQIGRNYDDMIQQEDYVYLFAEKLSGIGDIMQAPSIGNMKKGVYNTFGTIAMAQEGNQRQDTNIRDVREVMSSIALTSAKLQATFGQDDPMISTLPPETAEQVKAAIAYFNSDQGRFAKLEVKASNAGINQEVEKMNLLQCAQMVAQYGNTVQQMAAQLLNPQLNPGLRMIMNDIVKMQKWMATRLLREFAEFDAAEVLPDVERAIESVVPGGSRGTKDAVQGGAGAGMEPGSAGGAQQGLSREFLAAIASLPTLPQGNAGAGGMGPQNGVG